MLLLGKMGFVFLFMLLVFISFCNNILLFVILNYIYFEFVLVLGEFIMNLVFYLCRKESKVWGKKI